MRAHLSRFWLLYVVVIAGAFLRLDGIGFAHGIPKARPDEELFIQQALMLFSGDMNPHWAANGWPELYFFFIHIALQLKLWWLESTYGPVNLGCLYAIDPQQLHVPARMVAWLFGVLTIPLTYFFARDIFRREDRLGHIAGLGAAAILAFNVLHTRDSHFAVSDTALVFFMTLGLWQLVRAANTITLKPLFYAAFVFGVGCSIKYTGLVMIGMLGLAALERFFRAGSETQRRKMLFVGFALIATFMLGFVFASPHVLVEPSAFLDGLLSHNVRYSDGGSTWGYDPARVAERGIFFHGAVSVPVAIGWPLSLLGLAGTLLALWRARGGAFYVAFFVTFFYVAVLGPSTILFMRYTQPLFPPLAALAMMVPIELLRAGKLRGDDPRVVWATPVVLALLLALPTITIVQSVVRMNRQDTRDQALMWLSSNVEEGDMVRGESGFLSIPTLDQAMIDACLPAVPEPLHRPVVSWGLSGADFVAQVGQGRAGWGNIAKQYLERSADLGSTSNARFVVQSFPQLTCGDDVDYYRISDLPSCYSEVARFSPGVSDCGTRYDTFDMFMLPVQAPAGVVRPGPTVVIHRNGCRNRP